MAKKVQVVLTGVRRLDRKLKRLGSKEAKKLVTKAAREAVKPILLTARRYAPKDTGRLQKSIKVRALKRKKGRFGVRVTTGESDNQFRGRTFYGAFAEYGWTPGSRKSKRRGTPVMGELYMKRAARAKRDSALKIYRERIKQMLKDLSK